MAERKVHELKIDEEFRRLIVPPSSDELLQLEENIIRDGCREPLSVWYTTILDGHNRYEICTRLQIPFLIHRIYLKNREEAIAWVCSNQLGRRNITDEAKKYLIGKRYEMEKIIGAHNLSGINQHTKKEVRCQIDSEPRFVDSANRTREKLSEEYRISGTTIYRYSKYAHAIDSLSQISPELVPRILSGDVKIPHEDIIEFSQLPCKTVVQLSHLLTRDKTDFVGSLRKLASQKQRSISKRFIPATISSVKDMPIYDPDAEISGLSLTIPSWVSSINRARVATDLRQTSYDARCKLKKELFELKETIDSMLETIKEGV